MLVVTCIKQVPDTTQVKVDPITGTLIREGVPFIINPFDTYALEESLRLKEKYGFHVAVISMGPPNTEVTLRKALSLGADEVILLSDRAFGGADTLATSMVLAEAIKKLGQKEEVAIVICGRQTIDGDTAQVGPGIATRLGYSQLTLVDRIENVDLKAKKIRVRRRLEGRHEIVETTLPAMIAVLREINRPRYPKVPMRLFAQDAPVTLWNNKVMGLREDTIGLKGSATQVRKIFSPQRERGEIIGDGSKNPQVAARLLIDRLKEKNLLSL
ncbi:MAG: electron transfer flavoprotein subunit beta/FixA family protein [Candidatus Methanoperedens sp.]|nr:electron transfer flavoprotein subunit beta/FixA family protein [Candidatus Methanoperedens sp.]MCE8424220.1 electron transfer flavoprotein subunit beta/FixA family protein [Candidatus Methanoperedens sp.]MCE8427679.1 electron transfer flavoprotein subunit beta/FixA family protein [Candidatus Methanoperedens sp.]